MLKCQSGLKLKDMDEEPIKSYRFRFLNYWEADLPIEWKANCVCGNTVTVSDGFTECAFLIITARTYADLDVKGIEQKRMFMSAHQWLKRDVWERKPQLDHEVFQTEDNCLHRMRLWLLRGEAVFISIIHTGKVMQVDSRQILMVNCFVASLSLLEG